MWNKFQTTHPGVGTLVDVYIDDEQQYIKRIFDADSITCDGKPNRFDQSQVKEFFEWECYWLNMFKHSEWVPELIEIGENYTIQKYYRSCVLDDLHVNMPDITDQIIEMYKFFKTQKVFKRNGSLSNLTLNGDKLIAFDFKWARPRPVGINMELKSYSQWLNKADPAVEQKLLDLL